MLSKIINAIKTFFSNEIVGIIFQKLFNNVKTALIKELSDPENQRKAYTFVKELASRNDMTSKEKMETFNLKMLVYAKDHGKKLSDSMINCLRELALAAIKNELQLKELEESSK